MNKLNDLPPAEVIREWLSYDADLGDFRWLKDPTGAVKRVGEWVAGTKRHTGYIFVGLQGQNCAAHRLAWVYVHGSIPLGMEVDHIDGNPSNNALDNLRLATSSQQKQNKRVQSNNRSGLKGAYYHAAHKGKKWRTQIKVDGRLIFLGYYHTAQEAHEVYARAAREHFGAFARVA